MENLAQTSCLKHYLDATCTHTFPKVYKEYPLVCKGTRTQSHRLSNALKSPVQSQTSVSRSGEAQVTWSCCVQCQATVSRAVGASSDCAVMPAQLIKDRNFPDMPIFPAPPAKHNQLSARFCALLQLCTSYPWS